MGFQITDTTSVSLDNTTGAEGVASTLINDSQSSACPLVGGRLSFFRREWLEKLLKQCIVVTFFHSSTKKSNQTTLDPLGIQRLSKDLALVFYSHLVLVPKPHQR